MICKKRQADPINLKILKERVSVYNKKQGVRVGDYVIHLDGKIDRCTHDWGDSIQTGGHLGSHGYYLGEGYIEYSGGLDPSISKDKFQLTEEKRKGWIWFFNNNRARAANGVYYEIDFRVFKIIKQGDL